MGTRLESGNPIMMNNHDQRQSKMIKDNQRWYKDNNDQRWSSSTMIKDDQWWSIKIKDYQRWSKTINNNQWNELFVLFVPRQRWSKMIKDDQRKSKMINDDQWYEFFFVSPKTKRSKKSKFNTVAFRTAAWSRSQKHYHTIHLSIALTTRLQIDAVWATTSERIQM